jgi:exopolyphosphatase/guanosine-5'-triphosphate,3'-diphosphate pyrophosphatase
VSDLHSTPPSTSKRLAAIDVGSNSIRLLVVEADPDGNYRILDDEKETTRLAHGLAETGMLADEAIDRSLACLKRMQAIAQGYGAARLDVIATSAVREARNREWFLQLVQDRLNLKIDVISTSEEGLLSFSSAARHFDLADTNAVVVDLGGGSAELVLVANQVVEEIYSLPIGAVRLTDAFIHSDPLSRDEYQRLKKHVTKRLAEAVGDSHLAPHVMIGAGGTFTALGNISLRRLGDTHGMVAGHELNRAEVRYILRHLQHLPLHARRAVPGLHADRADIIVAGLIVIERLMKFFHINRLLIHDRGIRDGVILRMIRQTFPPPAGPPEEAADPLAGVRDFATACRVEPKHAQHVANLARQMFDQLKDVLHLPPAERLILEAAALLHEVGYLINYEKHHLHGYHLIMHGDLRGLSARQRELVANVAFYHRRAVPKRKHDNFARLAPADQDIVRRLSALLRVADGFDRMHTQRIQSIQCRGKDDRVYITVTADQSPDVDLWGAQQKGKFFEKVFGVELKLDWQATPAAKES